MIRSSFILIALTFTASAFASSPQLNTILPRGAQRGTELDVTFTGARLQDAKEVILYDQGITVSNLAALNAEQVTAHLKIAAGARLGEYRMRLRCASGISELKTFWVGPFPTTQAWAPLPRIPKKGDKYIIPNIAWETPQPLAMNTTVEGVIQNEQIHYYKINAKKGQRISAEVEGMRLGDDMFDPYLALVEPNKFVLAASDDTSLLKQDPYISLIAPKDEPLILEVRDSSFGGNANAHYRLHVGDFPRPSVCFPLGGKIGQNIDLQFLGDPKGAITHQVTLPNSPQASFPVYAIDAAGSPPSPNYLRVTDFPDVTEKSSDENHTLAHALAAPQEIPIAFNGVIAKPNGVDFFKFKAHRGQPVEINVFARQLRSPLDSYITVFDPKNQYLAANDDAGSPDSALRFNPPLDGDYTVAIQDTMHGGGPLDVYRIEVTPAGQGVAISIPNASQVLGPTQERQTIPVPRGGRYATLMRMTHPNVSGELQILAKQLPLGVKMTAIPSGGDVTPVLFEAAADAPIAGQLCDFSAERVTKSGETTEKIDSDVDQQVELVIGPPNQTPYYHTNVHQFAVAVTKPSPYSIELAQPKAALVQGGQIKLKVKAKREGDFKGPITLRMLFDPIGISGGTIQIPPDKTEIDYPISANDGAALKKWKIGILGEANVDGPLWVSTNLVDLQVAEPYFTGKIQMAAIEKGSSSQMICELNSARKFDGKATLRLIGLPPNTTAEPKEVAAGEGKVVFNVTTNDKTTPGQTTGLFVQASLLDQGEEVVGNFARGGVIRIDPASKNASNKPTVARASGDKPTSRLDKLRQEQAEAKH